MSVTVIGAGLAGLACAVELVDAGEKVRILEAGLAAGGRCRSYRDPVLGCRIDNGNHLILSGNKAAQRYLQRLGSADTLGGPAAPVFPFVDLASGLRWVLRPGLGVLPIWVFDSARRVPGTTPVDYLALVRWLRTRSGATVAQQASTGMLYDRLIEPLAIAALNTMPNEADAGLMGAVIRQSLLRGGGACIPAFPRDGLSESFVDPAIAILARGGAEVQFGCRVSGFGIDAGRVTVIETVQGPIRLGDRDRVVLAVPASVATAMVPGLMAPDAFEAILNVHFRADAEPGPAGFYGLIGGLSEWIFIKPGVVSVTISAANRFADLSSEHATAQCWAEVSKVCGLGSTMPPARVVREKRATFAATPVQNARRPAALSSGLANLVLAGDWTRTGLPATIEGSIRSGVLAASCVRIGGQGP